MAEARLAQRHERALLNPAAEVSGLGVPLDLTWVADGLEIAGDEFVERRSFRAGDLDDSVSRRGERHRLRPEVSKNSSTALSSNDGELARSIATCAPAMASLSPLPVMVLTPVLGEPATTSWPSSRKMATVFEPIRPVPPITTIFMGYPACRRFKAATLAKNLRGFPHRRKRRGGRLGSTELCNARGSRGSCGGNVSIERRRRDAAVTPMPGLASLALAASF